MSSNLNNDILQSAISYLARREHSTKELSYKLANKGFVAIDIAPVLAHLQQSNYLSDERYGESLINRRVSRGYGWRYISQELRHNGLTDEIISNLSKNWQIDWYLQVELAYNRRFGDAEIKDHKDKAKRIRFLQQRGFSSEQIFSLDALK